MKLFRILLKQDKVFKGDWNPTDGGTPVNKAADKLKKQAEDFAKDPINVAKKAAEDLYKETVRVTEDAFKVGGNIVNNVIDTTAKAVNDSGTAVSKGVKDTGKTVEKAVSDAGNVDYWDAVVQPVGRAIGDYFSIVLQAMWSPVKYGDRYLLNDNLDKFTGGFVTSVDNAAATPSEGLGGGRADDNLKDTVRVAMVTAAVMLTGGAGLTGGVGTLSGSAVLAGYTTSTMTAGMAQKGWGEVLQQVANTYLPKPVADIIGNIVNPPRQESSTRYDTFYSPTSAADSFIYEGGGILPVVIVGGGAIVVILLLSKLKKH